MKLTLDGLEVLDAIDRRGSFAAAAEELHRVPSAITYSVQQMEESLDIALFDRRGHWQPEAKPGRWADPEASFEQQQFWKVFEACLDHLPEKTARVFMMREILGLETDEICKETGISSSNCWVVLHRARSGLRICLETEWFAGAES